MTPARIVLVGYGSAGRGIHAPLLAGVGAPPCVVVTGDPQRAAAARQDLPDVEVAATLDDALAGPRPDLVVLASPSGAHAANALRCIAAGAPVVVDKPLAVDAASAREVVDAAVSAQVPLTVFQNRRWDAEHRALQRLLAQGALGEVRRFERRWERWRPVPKDRWRENADWRDGGGILLDLGPHLVDSAVHLFGPVTSVFAQTNAWTTPAEDDAFLALTHAGGVVSHLTASSVAPAPGPRTRVLGSQAAYVVTEFETEQSGFGFEDEPGCTGWLVRGGEREPVRTPPGEHADFYRAVLNALQENGYRARQAAMPVDPAQAVHTAAVLDAARSSAAQNQVVSL